MSNKSKIRKSYAEDGWDATSVCMKCQSVSDTKSKDDSLISGVNAPSSTAASQSYNLVIGARIWFATRPATAAISTSALRYMLQSLPDNSWFRRRFMVGWGARLPGVEP